MNTHPLAGVRVLDLTRLLPGPLCTAHLARLGADVIKIEDTGAGDYASAGVRQLVNAGKRSLRLDLKQPAGLAVLQRLCTGAHVLVESFRPGVMDRLGAGHAALSALQPALVYCSITGYGQDGPWRDEPGHDLNYCAITGVADQVGGPSGPGLSNLPLADLMGGALSAAMGILAALHGAQRDGRGCHLDIAMADAVMAHAVLPLAGLIEHGQAPARGTGTLTGGLACYGIYRTRDDRHVAVGALEPKFWQALCLRLQRPDWIALQHDRRPDVQARLQAELADTFASQPLHHWATLFDAAQACVTPVLRLDEALAHPQLAGRAAVLRGEDGQWQLGSPVKLAGQPRQAAPPSPAPGAQTDAILAELGYRPTDIDALRHQGVVA